MSPRPPVPAETPSYWAGLWPAPTLDHKLDTAALTGPILRLRLPRPEAGDCHRVPPRGARSREDRVAAIEQLSVLACIGLRHDTLQVELKEFEKLERQSRKGPPVPIIEEARRQLDAVERPFDIRLAATWGTQLQLVEAQENAVRFPHSILQAYLGSRLMGPAMADSESEGSAGNAGRELLIALVMHPGPSRSNPRTPACCQMLPYPYAHQSAQTHLTAPDLDATGPTREHGTRPDWPERRDRARPDGSQPGGARRRWRGGQAGPPDAKLPGDAAGKRADAKALTCTRPRWKSSMDPAPEHGRSPTRSWAKWHTQPEGDLHVARHYLVRRPAKPRAPSPCDAAEWRPRSRRTGPGRQRDVGPRPVYLLPAFLTSLCRKYYPVRLAAAQRSGLRRRRAGPRRRPRVAPCRPRRSDADRGERPGPQTPATAGRGRTAQRAAGPTGTEEETRGGGKDSAEEHHAGMAGPLARRFGDNPQFEGGRHRLPGGIAEIRLPAEPAVGPGALGSVHRNRAGAGVQTCGQPPPRASPGPQRGSSYLADRRKRCSPAASGSPSSP
jgi:hypothetical protein